MSRKSIRIVNINMVFYFFAAFTCNAQQVKSSLTLEDMYSNGTYQQQGFGPVRWMKDSKGYSTLEANKETGGKDIIRYDAVSAERSVVVNAKQLIPGGTATPLSISNYEWSDDNHKLIVFTNTKRVWRYNTKGDYWVLDIVTGKLQKVGKSLDVSSLMFAKFSPDASKVAYVSNCNIYVEDLKTGIVKQITTDGGGDIINGTFDWVYEEELDDRDGFRWSPDGENIAYWQSDTKGVGTFYLINNIDSNYSKPIPFPYPKVGTVLSAVKVGVVSASGGNTKWFNIPGDSRNNYIARMDFIPASQEVMIQQLNRAQNTNTVWIGDINKMTANSILVEKDAAFLDIHDNIRWLDNEKYFTWTSEREGWLHLFKVSRDGKKVQTITNGDFDVVKINCIDPLGGYVYYIASPDNFTQRYLYRSRIDGTGKAERITPSEYSGQNSYQISANAKWAIQVYQNAVTPQVYMLVSIPGNKKIKVLEDNHVLKAKYDALGLNTKEFIKVNIGDEMLDAFMIKPPGFDPAKKYPVLFFVYGEPAGSTVQDSWDGDLWNQYMALQGNIVMSIDNRGTNTPRGRAWHKSIYKQIGIWLPKIKAKRH